MKTCISILICLFLLSQNRALSQDIEMVVQPAHRENITQIACNATGNRLATFGDGKVLIRNIRDHKILQQINFPGFANRLCFATDSLLLIHWNNTSLALLDLSTGQHTELISAEKGKLCFDFDAQHRRVFVGTGQPFILCGKLDKGQLSWTDSLKFKTESLEITPSYISWNEEKKLILFSSENGLTGWYSFTQKGFSVLKYRFQKVIQITLQKDRLFILNPDHLKSIRFNEKGGLRSAGHDHFGKKFRQGVFCKNNDCFYVVNDDNKIYQFDVKLNLVHKKYIATRDKYNFFKDSGTNCIAVHPSQPFIIIAGQFGKVRYLDLKLKNISDNQQSDGMGITAIRFSKDGNQLMLARKNFINIWDFKAVNRYESMMDGEYHAGNIDRRTINGMGLLGNDTLVTTAQDKIRYWHISHREVYRTSKGPVSPLLAITVIPLAPVMVGSLNVLILPWTTVPAAAVKIQRSTSHIETSYGMTSAIDGTTRLKMISNNKQKSYSNLGGVFALKPDGKFLAMGKSSKIKIYRLDGVKRRESVWSIPNDSAVNALYPAWHPDLFQLFVSKNKSVKMGENKYKILSWISLYDSAEKMPGKNFGYYLSGAAFNNRMIRVDRQKNRVYYLSDPSTIAWVDMQTCQMPADSSLHYFKGFSQVVSYDLHPQTGKLAVAYEDGTIIFWDPDSARIIATMVPSGLEEFILKTPDHYYFATSQALNSVTFTRNQQYFSFSQFDLQYNRPDIVLSRLGFTQKNAIDLYHEAYQKRLKKYKLSENRFTADFHVPVASIKNKDSLQIQGGNMALRLSASDDQFPLRYIHILVNGVPVFGSEGYRINNDSVHQWEQTFNIQLSSGKNIIRFYAANSAGVSSLSDVVEYEWKNKSESKLYLISIGVSEYANPAMNLKYASKDASDIAEKFRKKYKNPVNITLTNQEATRENILKIRNLLTQTHEDDKVIFSFSGHGLVDTGGNFYFATFDTDFEHPEKNGLSYETIYEMLDKIPARNRLLLMDACHSGELDKEVTYVSSNGNPQADKKGVTLIQTGKKDIPMQSAFELMMDVFSTVTQNNGATVISAAAGTQFALEGRTWQNGVFTYTLLEGLQSNKADLNKDGNITVSELKSYTGNRVQVLTHGQQKPNARQVNLENDWVIWTH